MSEPLCRTTSPVTPSDRIGDARRRLRLAVPFPEDPDLFDLAEAHDVVPEDHGHEHGPDCGHLAVRHGDHVDYVHDGHRHAPHGSHYDEH